MRRDALTCKMLVCHSKARDPRGSAEQTERDGKGEERWAVRGSTGLHAWGEELSVIHFGIDQIYGLWHKREEKKRPPDPKRTILKVHVSILKLSSWLSVSIRGPHFCDPEKGVQNVRDVQTLDV